MSRASTLTLLGSSLFAATTIVLVHFQQEAERKANMADGQVMHAGVERDMEQLRVKKERQLDFEMQAALEAKYKQSQTVHEVIDEAEPARRTS